MSDFVTAIEFDGDGNLWIGSPGGIQIYNGVYYQVIKDQQLLKDPDIRGLQRWDNDMWVATGNAGIQRFRNGTWTWFQPYSPGGPGFYEVSSMALDPATDALVIATEHEGLWTVRSHDDPVRFEMIADKTSSFGLLDQVRRDPLGGVYFFNNSWVVHYSANQGFAPMLSGTDLTVYGISIHDLAAGSDGKLYLATDDGIYIWENGGIYRHLNRFEGIGTSSIVKTVSVDAEDRVWFSTQGYVGYYIDQSQPENTISVETALPTQSPVPGTGAVAGTIPAPREGAISPTQDESSESSGGGISAIIDPIIRAIGTLLSGFGIR
jgi:ligand-binding sensor domain-containing protein